MNQAPRGHMAHRHRARGGWGCGVNPHTTIQPHTAQPQPQPRRAGVPCARPHLADHDDVDAGVAHGREDAGRDARHAKHARALRWQPETGVRGGGRVRVRGRRRGGVRLLLAPRGAGIRATAADGAGVGWRPAASGKRRAATQAEGAVGQEYSSPGQGRARSTAGGCCCCCSRLLPLLLAIAAPSRRPAPPHLDVDERDAVNGGKALDRHLQGGRGGG